MTVDDEFYKNVIHSLIRVTTHTLLAALPNSTASNAPLTPKQASSNAPGSSNSNNTGIGSNIDLEITTKKLNIKRKRPLLLLITRLFMIIWNNTLRVKKV